MTALYLLQMYSTEPKQDDWVTWYVIVVCDIDVQTHDIVEMESNQTDLHLVLELSSDTTSSMMPPPSTTTVPTSACQPVLRPGTCSPTDDKQKAPRRVQLTTLK